MWKNLKQFILLAILLVGSLKVHAATLSADWTVNQDSATQYTIEATITAVNGNVRGIEVFLDLAAAYGSGNYTFTVSQSSTTTQLLNLNGGYDGDIDDQIVNNTILQNTTVVLTVVVTVTDPSLVDVSALSGLVISTNPSTTIPITPLLVSIDTYSDIGLANQTSYSFSGVCSESGNSVFVVVSDGINNINTTVTCLSDSWSVAGLNVSSLNDGNITITATHSNGIDTVQAQVTVSKATTADISVSKTDSSTTYTPGSNSIYNITVSNAGPLDVVGISVVDAIPNGGTATWTCSATGAASCTASGSGNINELVNIPAGESVTFLVTVSWSINPADY